jgi:4-hydroxy-2-oxoheptanedioate aldolase
MKSIIPALKSGTPQLGLCVMYPSPGALERIGPDWDWAWLDGQHGQNGYSELISLVRACDLVNIPAIVRVPGHEPGPISLALDMGAAGVIVPCVDTPEQAHAIVKAGKFPPLGNRSYGGRRPVDFGGRAYSDTANEDTLLVLQIESPEAIENAAEIAAIPGVDALFLGPDDIMLRRGYPVNAPRNRETLGDDMEAVVAACRRHNKYSVMVGRGAEMLNLCLEIGFDLIVAGGDVPFLVGASEQASKEARAVVEKRNAQTLESRGGGAASLY